MIPKYITEADILKIEPSLTEYEFRDKVGWAEQIEASYSDLCQFIKNKGMELKKLGIPLTLSTSKVEDKWERQRFVCKATGTGDIKLLGSNDDETYEEVARLVFTASGEQTIIFHDVRKYYKYEKDSTLTIAKAYLVETDYDKALTYLVLHNIYKSLTSDVNTVDNEKSKLYWDLYLNTTDGMQMRYDADESGEYTEDEVKISTIRLMRG
jgi:hypothetical protein